MVQSFSSGLASQVCMIITSDISHSFHQVKIYQIYTFSYMKSTILPFLDFGIQFDTSPMYASKHAPGMCQGLSESPPH